MKMNVEAAARELFIDRFAGALKRYYGGATESDDVFTESEIAATFDAWLRQVKAEAWDEGHRHCFHVEDPNNPVKGNPYRSEK